MINLDNEKDYYILVDNEGGNFGGGRIFESKKEVFEQFEQWADSDERDITGYTMADLIDTWNIDIRYYNGSEFRPLLESEFNETK